jgi:transcriptional regulator
MRANFASLTKQSVIPDRRQPGIDIHYALTSLGIKRYAYLECLGMNRPTFFRARLTCKVVALEPIHGYAIVQRLQQISKEALQIRQGSLYPALYRLERRGWLKADWKTTEGGREAKFYSLTREGRRQLESETAGWKRLCEAISLVLETPE